MTTEEENLYQFLGEESNFENALLVIKHMPGMRNFSFGQVLEKCDETS
ncbi:MAG: hypothetical protein IPP17_20910 [Bacteroidetes bacterium]|nr:hypothetical protein [Bacteroidota bacterium]